MEALGTGPAVTDFASLPRWIESMSPEYNMMIDDASQQKQSPFSWSPDINNKIIIWNGDIVGLNTQAVVHSSNETFTDKNPINVRLMERAGPELRHDIKHQLKVCKTGDARITKGYRLPARHVIHTVGPRYSIKYRTAAESALFACYRNILQLLLENHITSLGVCCIHSQQRGYPLVEGAHIAIRAVRRFLEKFGSEVETIVFVVTGEEELVYGSLLPLYFPRSQCEAEYAAYHLPDDVGNEDGEPIIEERQIRILGKPTVEAINKHPLDAERMEESININEAFDASVAVGNHDFARMEADFDTTRKKHIRETHSENLVLRKSERYTRWLRRARSTNLSNITSLRFLYQSGFDKYGRPVVMFVGKNFPAASIDYEKALMSIIEQLDALVDRQYIVVYLHTLTNKQHHPSGNFLKDLFSIADFRYINNLQAIYLLHFNLWSKLTTWWLTTFQLSELKPKLVHLPGLEYLFTRIPPDQLDLPAFVTEYDQQLLGTRYYDPEEDESIGAL